MMNKVLDWFRTEPVRTVVYPAMLLVLSVLVTKGVVTQDYNELIIEFLSVLVFGSAAAETARSKVTPVAKVEQAIDEVAAFSRPAAHTALTQIRDRLNLP